MIGNTSRVKSGGGFCGPSPHTTTEASRLKPALAAIIVIVYLVVDIGGFNAVQ
jgi:hypothetical protein